MHSIRLKKIVKHSELTLEYIARRLQEIKYKYNLKKLIYDIDKVKIDRPIFLLGTQGCGGTLISRMIRRHPNVVYICGNHKKWTFKDEIHNSHWNIKENIPDELSLRSPGYKNTNDKLKNHHIFGFERSWLYATNELLSEYRLTEKDASKELKISLENIIKNAIIAYDSKNIKPRFTDMSQTFTIKISFINELLKEYNPKYLLITRNPYAMCFREVNKQTNKYKNFNKELIYQEKLELACEHWTNSYKYALIDKKKIDNLKIIRFEDVLEHPKENMKSICNYLQLDFKENMIPKPNQKMPFGSRDKNKWYPVNTDVNKPYLDNLSAIDVEIIEKKCGSLIDKFGYTKNGKINQHNI